MVVTRTKNSQWKDMEKSSTDLSALAKRFDLYNGSSRQKPVFQIEFCNHPYLENVATTIADFLIKPCYSLSHKRHDLIEISFT